MARRQSDVPPFVDAACGSPAPDVRRGAVHGLAAPRRSQTRGGRAAADYRSLAINLPGGGRGTQLFLLLLFVLAEGGRPKKSWAHGVRRWRWPLRAGARGLMRQHSSAAPTRGEPTLARRNHGTHEREKALTSHGNPSEYNRAQPSTSNARTQAAELRLAEMRGAPRLPRCRRRVITAACGLDVTAPVPTPADRRKRGARPRGAPQAEASRAAARWPAASFGGSKEPICRPAGDLLSDRLGPHGVGSLTLVPATGKVQLGG